MATQNRTPGFISGSDLERNLAGEGSSHTVAATTWDIVEACITLQMPWQAQRALIAILGQRGQIFQTPQDIVDARLEAAPEEW